MSTSVTSTGAGAVLALNTATPAYTTFSKTGLSITINNGSYLWIRFVPIRPNVSGAGQLVVISNLTVGGTVNSSATTPLLTTTAASSITNTTATVGGNISSDGGATVTRRGVVYSTGSITDTTTITGGGKIINGSTGTGSYTASLSGLTQNTTYNVRAFAINSAGITYGSQSSFTTTNISFIRSSIRLFSVRWSRRPQLVPLVSE
jgi:hypothetical protein